MLKPKKLIIAASSLPVGLSTNKEATLQAKYSKIVNELELKVSKFEANNPQSVNDGVALIKEAQFYEGEIDDTRVAMVKPHNDYVKSINALAKALSDPFSNLKKVVNAKVKEYNDKVLAKAQEEKAKLEAIEKKKLAKIEADRKAREDEERAKREAEEKSGKIDEEARRKREANEDKLRIKEDINLSRVIGKQSSMIDQLNQDAKVKGMQKRWTFRVINPAMVDRSFCSPDSVKINAAIKAGLRQAEGLEIYEDAKVI